MERSTVKALKAVASRCRVSLEIVVSPAVARFDAKSSPQGKLGQIVTREQVNICLTTTKSIIVKESSTKRTTTPPTRRPRRALGSNHFCGASLACARSSTTASRAHDATGSLQLVRSYRFLSGLEFDCFFPQQTIVLPLRLNVR